MIKGRDGNRRSSSDLLVCFPPRAHLALTPKTICSPSRLSDSANRRFIHRRQLSKFSAGGSGAQGSPALWAKQANNENMGEPTSPKVTCAGQIRVRPSKYRVGKGKNWQSVMAEIEKIHNKRTTTTTKSKLFGFLTCLKNIRFDLRCFGDFRHVDITSDEEEDEEEEEEEESSKNVFSKWFMVLQEEHSNKDYDEKRENSDAEAAVPPPNALLLMRCRSAPHLEEKKKAKTEQEEEKKEEEMRMKKEKKKDLRSLMEEEKMELVLMRYDTEFYRLSSDIAKETWVVGGIQDPLSRSLSCKN